MDCSVCMKHLGLWTKLTAHPSADVCKDCRAQGNNRLEVLMRSVRECRSFRIQFAEGWIGQYEEMQRKFRMPESEVGPLRLSFFDSIFRLVESEESMAEGDLQFILAVSQNYSLTEPDPELRDTLIRIGMKEIIQSWEKGEAPRKNCTGLILQKGESCHWEEGSGLRLQKNK